MAGTRVPSNAAPTDSSSISTVSNMNSASYYANSAQSLYSGLWQDIGKYIDNYCSITRSRHSGARTGPSAADFSPSSSIHRSLSHQSYTFPRNVDATVDFANLASTCTDANAINLDNDSADAPTIQFDLGNNLLSCSSQQRNLGTFSAPCEYSSNSGIETELDAEQSRSCFANNSPLASTLWNLGDNFACPQPNQGTLSTTNLDNVSTVDYTARWDMGNNINSSPINQSSVGNNLQNPEPFERRLRTYLHDPSPVVKQSLDDVLQHRLYMIDKKIVGDPHAPTACDYQVLGGGGNVYTVRLATIPSCTCPDPQRECKHVLFIMLRVLKLPAGDYRFWKAAFQKAVNLAERVQDSSHQSTEGGGESDLQNFSREVSGDCPVCMEMMGHLDGSANEELFFCKVCSTSVHKDCFQRWSMSRQESGDRCIACRSLWFDDRLAGRVQLTKRKAASDVGQEGYVNLADYSSDQRTEDMTLERFCPPHVKRKQLSEWRGCN